VAVAGPGTVRYGGNTSCVEVRRAAGDALVLDAGTGIRALGHGLGGSGGRVDLLLTHLHMDHLQGLGFFAPLFEAGREVHIWGPPSTTLDLRGRLTRYLSPPLFPVRLRDVAARLTLHDAPLGRFAVPGFTITTALVCHPGPTLGYRIEADGVTVTYLPDHEPALGPGRVLETGDWVSGFDLAAGADLLIHDAQYSGAEYPEHVGWGHSAVTHAVAVARLAGVRRLVTFHHDPAHDDDTLDRLLDEVCRTGALPFELIPGMEGMRIEVAPAPLRR
jgi:phosphoribosyl 1,2-cyclic phosphodiesterase